MKNNYEVGQVVYLLRQKTLKIIPAVVVEEIVRKTLIGSSTQYVIKYPDDEKGLLNEVSEDVFCDIDSLRAFMLENTRKSVDQLINNALKLKAESFENMRESVSVEDESLHGEEHVQNDIKDVIMNSDYQKIQPQEAK